jgi:hypothetical protein
MPAIEFHDELMKSISEAIEKIPILPQMIEQLEEQLSVWVFSIMAPLVVPVLQQVKNELRTGSTEIIESSKNEQLIVFNDDRCSDPTHSMLSKDHFSNVSIYAPLFRGLSLRTNCHYRFSTKLLERLLARLLVGLFHRLCKLGMINPSTLIAP